MNSRAAAIAVVLASAPCGITLAAEGVLTVGAGAEYSSGKYGGTEKTQIFYLPVTAKYETGPWAFKAVVPYIRVTGPGNVVGAGADRVTLPGAPAARRTDSGLGDVVASVFNNLVDERQARFGVDVGAKVKLGTADEAKGLGTGETDYAVQADFYMPLGALTAFGTLGYRWYGDPPGVDLKDVFYGAIGASYRVSGETSVGLAYDLRPRITTTGARISEATAFISQRLSREWRAQFYSVLGFSDGSPDFGLGATLNYRF